MKVRFIKNYKTQKGKKILKGAEEAFTKEIALDLIEKRYAVKLVEYEDTGLVNEKEEPILKLKEE